MSMLDGFFNKGFKAAKCKTLLKLTIPRIKLLRNRREIQLKQMRKDIAKLLENGQEATARIRVEHIVREENMMAAQEIMELFCELISVRLPIIETQRECPLDLREAISSICFAAPRCADLPELQQVQMLFAAKYGKEFVAAATELMPDCGVNRQIIELLSIRAPSVETKLKLLKEIAEEHEVDWDPSATETEFLKPHEDLLNGPNHFTNGSNQLLSEEKYNEALSSRNVEESYEESDSDAGFDSLDLPEVPKVSVKPAPDIPSAPAILPDLPSASRHDSTLDHEVKNPTQSNEDRLRIPTMEPKIENPEPSLASRFVEPDVQVAARENKQFIPFVSPPSLSSPSVPARQSEPASSPPSFSSVLVPHKQSEQAASPASFSPPSLFSKQSEPAASPTSFSPPSLSTKPSEPAVSLSRTKSEANVDLQDVLAAAHAAAETAERAAAAARAAANLAQVRITDLVTQRNNRIPESFENEIQGKDSHQSAMEEKPLFHSHDSFGQNDIGTSYELNSVSGSPAVSSREAPNAEVKSPDLKDQMPEDQPAHVPQRLSSLEDDPYFSYPNLFSRQDSNLKSGVQTSANSKSTDDF